MLICFLFIYLSFASGADDEESDPPTGIQARRGAFPSVAAILRDGRQFCAGTLVDGTHILTAANCVSFLSAGDLPRLSVYLNTVSLKTYNPGAIISKVIRFKAHEFYDKKTHANDIALLTLDTNVTTLYPQALIEDDSAVVGKNGTILRWGAGKDSSTIKKVLLQASVSVISNAECMNSYDKQISSKSICATSNAVGEGTCEDDSVGGPLIVDGRQIGITSWGKGCMDSKFPGVWSYTRLSSYKSWIESNLAAI